MKASSRESFQPFHRLNCFPEYAAAARGYRSGLVRPASRICDRGCVRGVVLMALLDSRLRTVDRACDMRRERCSLSIGEGRDFLLSNNSEALQQDFNRKKI